MFKKISDCYGGFVEVNEETKRFSQLQWARILVKTGERFYGDIVFSGEILLLCSPVVVGGVVVDFYSGAKE